jgi:hypothetical protein
MLAKKQNGALLLALILNVHSGMVMGANPSPSPPSAKMIKMIGVIVITGTAIGLPVLGKVLDGRLIDLPWWEEEKELRKILNRSWLEKKFYGEINVNEVDHKHPSIPTLLHKVIVYGLHQTECREHLKKANLLMEHGADLHMVRNNANITPFEEIVWYTTLNIPKYREFGKQLLFICQRNGRMTRAMYDQAEAAGVHMTDEAISAHLRTPRSSVARRLAKTAHGLEKKSKTRIDDQGLVVSKLVAEFLTSTPLQKEEPQEREGVFPEQE